MIFLIIISVFLLHTVNCISIQVDRTTFEDTISALLQNETEEEDHYQAKIPNLPNENSINNKNNQQQQSKPLLNSPLPSYPSYLNATNSSWQPVNGTEYKFFVYSAFFDGRNDERIIRVMSATKLRKPDRVWCRYWYETNSDQKWSNNGRRRVVSRKARMRVIRENWRLPYSAYFVICPLRWDQTVPVAVSIVAKVKSPPSNLLAVINNYEASNGNKPAKKFGICVKPIHYHYNKAIQFLEFIELNRILGVEHFTFYNHTIGPQVECILKDYVKRGIVTILPWQLDMVSQKEIRTECMFAAFNDCLYRSMNLYAYVVFVDLDEFIIPRHNATLEQLIHHMDETISIGDIGSYSVQNAFFYLHWDDDYSIYDLDDPIATAMVTLKKTRRRVDLNPHTKRSKYICRPELVVEAGNHFVWEYVMPDFGTVKSPPNLVMMHHYRACESGGNSCVKHDSTVDASAYKFKTPLVNAVRKKFDYFRQMCNL